MLRKHYIDNDLTSENESITTQCHNKIVCALNRCRSISVRYYVINLALSLHRCSSSLLNCHKNFNDTEQLDIIKLLLSCLQIRRSLTTVYFGHTIRKCFSSSTLFIVHCLHCLSITGVFEIVCLPISMCSLWELVLNRDKFRRSESLLTHDNLELTHIVYTFLIFHSCFIRRNS